MSDTRMIARAWTGFERMVVPLGASEAQREDMRKAFFAGASTMFVCVVEQTPDGSDDAVKFLRSIEEEVSDFGDELDEAVLGNLANRGGVS